MKNFYKSISARPNQRIEGGGCSYLLLRTLLTLTHRTPQRHLDTRPALALQVRLCNICQCLDEQWVAIERFGAFDSRLLGLGDDFQV